MSGGLLGALAQAGTTQPVEPAVPADDAGFRLAKGDLKVAAQVAKRRLLLAASGERRRLVERIDPAWRRAIWLHVEAPQIGDALMDLAPRSLLAERGLAVDLYAPPAVAALFRGDRWLGAVLEDPADVDAARYDAAIVDGFAPRSIAVKRRLARGLPWVALRGDYLAYDFQRALLATRRLAALLGVRLDEDAEAWHARQKLDGPGDLGRRGRTLPADRTVALAIGGVRAERRYGHWPAVARLLADAGVARLVLVGSDNGRADADAVSVALAGSTVAIDDLVARTDLHATREAIADADLALAADGGLMHLALTTSTPLVALFDASIDPVWRLPARFAGRSLRATIRDVGAIAPADIVAAASALLESDARR